MANGSPVAAAVVQSALHHKLSSSAVFPRSEELLLPLLPAPVAPLVVDTCQDMQGPLHKLPQIRINYTNNYFLSKGTPVASL